MTFYSPKESLINLTEKMDKKEKFAYLNIPKSAIVALSKNSDNAFPSHFAKNVISSFKAKDESIMKAIPNALKDDVANNKHYKIGLNKSSDYYYSNIFEYYYNEDREVYDSIVSYFIKNTKTLAVSFNDKKFVTRCFGYNCHVVNVPYSSQYDKVDDVYAQISELDGDIDYVLLDCGIFGLGLLPKVWENLSVSVIDLGKTLISIKNDMKG
jgi:hypothetical protein